MNTLGISLVWLAAQVTLLCLVTAVIYFVARRRYPAAGATAALTGLLLAAALTLVLFSPWPRWSFDGGPLGTPLAAATDGGGGSADDERAAHAAGVAGESTENSRESGDATNRRDVELDSPLSAALTAFWDGVGRELTQPKLRPASSSFRWPAWLAVSLLLMMGLGAARLAAGWLSVRGSLRRSRPITEPSLGEMIDVFRAELGCPRPVELRESSDVASAATVGWRKPVILLPPDWRGWSERERRAVVAHELAHVTAGDAATWLAAQFGLLLHFYHPLVHWLTHRLRLEQELAADALAARLTGSPQIYLTTLAELAVRQPDRPIAWPARAFLPTRGTLLRRIEMLRDTKSPPLRSSNLRRGAVIALTIAAGVFVAGLRPPEAEQVAAQDRGVGNQIATKPAAGEAKGFNLENVPATTSVLLGIRPARLANRPELQQLSAWFEQALESEKTGIEMKQVDQFLVFARITPANNGQSPAVQAQGSQPPPSAPVMELRMTGPTDFTAFLRGQMGEIQAEPGGERPHYIMQKSEWPNMFPMAGLIVDDRTLLYGRQQDLQEFLDNRGPNEATPAWAARFESVANDALCFVGDMTAFRPLIQKEFERQPNPFAGMFAPLWQKTDLVIGGAKVNDRLALTVNGWTANAEDAARLEKTLGVLVPFATGFLETAKASAKQAPPDTQIMLPHSLNLLEQVLDNITVHTADDRVTVTVQGDAGSVATMAAAILPAITQAREAARRTQSMNNLKQIGLAFHNFHDTYRHFPPPVLYGKAGNGKSQHPHSWRVAILPFVDQAPLYDLYHFDEPWDSEHNLKIAAQVPAVFRSPNDQSGSTNASYYVLVGENTAVGSIPEPDGNPTKGLVIRDVTDGTSNTLLVVEAQRDIPWTKPEDIPYSPDAEIPQLGGLTDRGFLAGIVDGSVRFISENIDETTLRALITRNGGEVLPNF
ncbi:MAG: DUF1559 domain-containing protein [Planctomycetaceae bacterium]|nr:DUF1559 domain-containing protein [Planctomycetaceae bacterium]